MNLKSVAQALLAEAVAALGTRAPTRRYLHTGTPAADCEQLIVALTGAARTFADQAGIIVDGITRAAEFTVIVDRCAPTISGSGTPPADAAVTQAAEAILDDLDALWALVVGGGCDRRALLGVNTSTTGGIARLAIGISVQW